MPEASALSNRTAVVVGASSGIGEATARELASLGAPVAILARRIERLEEVAAEIEAKGGRVLPYRVDVTDRAALAEVAARIEADLGPASIVFNNAGVMLPTPISDPDGTSWNRQVDLNVNGFNNVVHVFAPQLIASAAKLGVADLVNTASIAARTLFPTFSVYAASKAYVSHFGDTLRAEFGPVNVRVTTVEPGIVETELQGHISDERVKQRLARTRQSVEWLQPEDLAQMVAFIVTRHARVNFPRIAVLPTRQVN